MKHEIRVALEKAKTGGKKAKGGKNAAPIVEAPKESCLIAIGSQYPLYQQQVLEILSAQQWTDGKNIVGQEYIGQVRSAITNKKEQGVAMKFAAFVIKEASEVGKEEALMQSMPFDERELLSTNNTFLFENMSTIKNISAVPKEDASIDAVAGARQIADNAVPGKPTIFFY